jgi:hypothetical protein
MQQADGKLDNSLDLTGLVGMERRAQSLQQVCFQPVGAAALQRCIAPPGSIS